MSFMNGLKETLSNETQLTENGAVGYKTTGKKLLDLNFSVTSFRNKSDREITNKFIDAFYEDKLLAMKWLFYCRDREAVGERRTFRVVMKYLAENHPAVAKSVVELIPAYGRYDDVLCLLDTEVKRDVIAMIKKQLNMDAKNMMDNRPVSLLAKWLPSANASSRETKRFAKMIYKSMGMTEKQYRQTLSKLRKYLNVVEVKMSAKEWRAIDYSAVPSRANLIYNGAFLRNDEERRRAYLDALSRGDKSVKINAGVLFPHDIVHRYTDGRYRVSKPLDTTLEELWKALPDYVKGAGNTICVADGSGSMTSTISGTKVSCLDVANALAVYFAERSSGQFKDNYITFSERPQLVDFSNAKTLREKLEIASRHNEVANTNIEAVFDLILKTAVDKGMTQDELPQNILILSDMEFDSCATTNRANGGWRTARPTATLFDEIRRRYAAHGYKLPRLVFWNICSRTGTIPVKENDLGVALVSGFSPAIVKMVLSNSTDPFECLLEQLNTERYVAVEAALKNVI